MRVESCLNQLLISQRSWKPTTLAATQSLEGKVTCILLHHIELNTSGYIDFN